MGEVEVLRSIGHSVNNIYVNVKNKLRRMTAQRTIRIYIREYVNPCKICDNPFRLNLSGVFTCMSMHRRTCRNWRIPPVEGQLGVIDACHVRTRHKFKSKEMNAARDESRINFANQNFKLL